MRTFKVKLAIPCVIPLALLVCTTAIIADTWQLGQNQTTEETSKNQGQDKYLSAVARMKNLVNSGQAEKLREAAAQFKKDFPQIAGPDLDVFISGELFFAKAKFAKAMAIYDKLLAQFPESKLYEATLDRQFSIATAYLEGEKIPVLGVFRIKGYAEGLKIMENIIDKAGDAPIAYKAALSIAQHYEQTEQFNEAYHQWSQIASTWPTGQTAADALLGMARCKHAAYRGPRYDSSNLISARTYYDNYRSRFPEDAKKFDADKRIKQIDEQLAYKLFNIANYYEGTGNKQPANLYYQMITDNWPNSTAAIMAKTSKETQSTPSKKRKK